MNLSFVRVWYVFTCVYMDKAPASAGVLSVCLHVPRELSVHLHSVPVSRAELIKFR